MTHETADDDDGGSDGRDKSDGPDTAEGRDTSWARASSDEEGQTCSRCGGEAVPARMGAVPVLECADCGKVVGLVDAEFDPVAEADRPVRTDEVTATDGELGQLVTLLRTEATDSDGSDRTISTERLLLSTESATLEIRACGDDVEIREVDLRDDRGGASWPT